MTDLRSELRGLPAVDFDLVLPPGWVRRGVAAARRADLGLLALRMAQAPKG